MIFIIDDGQSLERAFLLLLKSAGFDVKGFSSAEEFLTYSPVSDDDCIILDLRMPGMKGFELMDKLISKGIHTPVICVNAFDDAKSREQARKLGAVAYFTKPVDNQALIDTINWAAQSGRRIKS